MRSVSGKQICSEWGKVNIWKLLNHQRWMPPDLSIFCSVDLDYPFGGKLLILHKKSIFSGHRATEFLKWKWLWEYPKRLFSQYTIDYTVTKTAGHICATRFSHYFKMKRNCIKWQINTLQIIIYYKACSHTITIKI